MMDVRKLQAAVGAAVDGVAGIGTYTALFRKCGATQERAADMAVCANRYFGEYGVMAADLAVEEINAAGGIGGRQIELIKEDSVNPQTASTKAERMVERDEVVAIVGEISSASALTIASAGAWVRRSGHWRWPRCRRMWRSNSPPSS